VHLNVLNAYMYLGITAFTLKMDKFIKTPKHHMYVFVMSHDSKIYMDPLLDITPMYNNLS
jgi:hypothetical protein